jgi:orotidine-5'-phosphate decarboxylase
MIQRFRGARKCPLFLFAQYLWVLVHYIVILPFRRHWRKGGNMTDHRLILALDGLDESKALVVSRFLGQHAYCVKVHDLLDGSDQPDVIRKLKDNGANRVWVDYKLHDIPKTVERRVRKLAMAGADIVTVHASGHIPMMQAAMQAGIEILAITVLTSLDDAQVAQVYNEKTQDEVLRLASLAADARVTGLVCSGLEVGLLRGQVDSRLRRVVPGTRSAGAEKKGQTRSTTPREALESGAHQLVIASQVVEAADPVVAWHSLVAEIA